MQVTVSLDLDGCRDIAVVGMSVRLPGATGVDAYWQNLRSGLSSIRHLSEEELMAAGVPESRSAVDARQRESEGFCRVGVAE